MKTLILGGGMTGLAAGAASGLPVFEAAPDPGGICSSYYVRPGSTERHAAAPADGEAYRFEIGGGHWIFGGDPTILQFVRRLSPMRRYERRSAIYFPDTGKYVPYPLQYHLRYFEEQVATRALDEMGRERGEVVTMADWLRESFGETLSELFFEPFHKLYTAGLYTDIAPQDAYKSPVNLETARQGATGNAPSVGYNISYLYPERGLDHVSRQLADRCDIRFGKKVVSIDPDVKLVGFEDGSSAEYDTLVSTLPLNVTQQLAGVTLDQRTDPHTSVLVLNVGAVKGPECPEDHWLYHHETSSGFHRVGFYSNVDSSFLPASAREREDRVSIYVEKAFQGGDRPSAEESRAYGDQVVAELQDWGYIGDAEVVDPTWIDVAYTWAWPGSTWRREAMKALEQRDIYPVGRYARWSFQGIADSIRDGLMAGGAFPPDS